MLFRCLLVLILAVLNCRGVVAERQRSTANDACRTLFSFMRTILDMETSVVTGATRVQTPQRRQTGPRRSEVHGWTLSLGHVYAIAICHAHRRVCLAKERDWRAAG